MVKKTFPTAIVIFVSILAVLDLANYGIPPTHDGEYHVIRFQQFVKALSEGNLYPRWAPDLNNGFGVPLFNYVYPLPNYVAAIFHVLGFGFIDSLKLNMAAATIVGAIFMYLWSRKYWGEWGGVVSSVFYTFSPYHLLDIYVRGSVGEVWSLGLMPGLAWSYLNFFETKRVLFFCLSAIFLALLVLSHNILALIFFAFFIVYAGFLIWSSKHKKEDMRNLALIIFLGLGLSSSFWLPALLEAKYVVGLQVFDPTQHFPVLYKLIYSSWGYGFSGASTPDQMSFQIGIANLVAFFGSTVILFLSKNKKTLVFFIALFLASVFLITPFSVSIWKSIPPLSYIQFPWRLLSLVILVVSLLAGSLVQESLFRKNRRAQIMVVIFLILLSIGLSLRYAKAPFYHKRADEHYLTRANFIDGTNSPGNVFNTIWFDSNLKRESKKLIFLAGHGRVREEAVKSTNYKFYVSLDTDSKLQINTAYFPGWTVFASGKRVPYEKTENGLGTFALSKGEYVINAKLENTLVRNISTLLSLLSLLTLVGIFLKAKFATIKK